MKRSRWNPQDVTTGVQTNNVIRITPTKIDQVEDTSAREGQQVVLLVRVQIKLPGPRVALIRWAHGWPAVDDQIAGIGLSDRDVEETNSRRIAELLVGNQLKHLSLG